MKRIRIAPDVLHRWKVARQEHDDNVAYLSQQLLQLGDVETVEQASELIALMSEREIAMEVRMWKAANDIVEITGLWKRIGAKQC